MPEGDSIHRIQKALVDLVGRPIERATTQGLVRASVVGRTIAAIDAHGKHLVIALDDGAQIRAHLGMYGRFHRFARADGDARVAHMSPGRASLVLALPDEVLLWSSAKTIEILPRRAPRHGMAIASLGPDVLGADFDPRAAAERASREAPRMIADVLLDQRIAAGIGNVYKTEVCYLHRVDPRTRVAAIPIETLVAMYIDAQRLLHANAQLGSGPRRTTPDGDDRYFAYARTNRPCRRCASPIACFSVGDPPRWTWSCPRCQPSP